MTSLREEKSRFLPSVGMTIRKGAEESESAFNNQQSKINNH